MLLLFSRASRYVPNRLRKHWILFQFSCSLIFDVEYDQSGNDPMLRTTMSREGDWIHPETGLSTFFPGMTNNLVLNLDSYLKVCLALLSVLT